MFGFGWSVGWAGVAVGGAAGIMGDVVERPDGQQGQGPERQEADAPGTGLEPARGAAPGPAEPDQAGPHGIDPEQARQFQQFQQFQEFLRFQQTQQADGRADLAQPPGQPPAQSGQAWLPAQPPQQQLVPAEPRGPRAPRWLRWLGKKLLGWLIFFVLLAIGLTVAYNHFFGTEDEGDRPAAETGGGTYKTNEILSTEPYEAVRQVYDAVAQEDPATRQPSVEKACGRFAEATQQQFAQNMGYPDCRQAVLALHEQVTHVNDYAESMPSHRSQPADGDTVRISSCRDSWSGIKGGPPLGAFTVTRVEKGQWLITGHQPETCPAPTTPGGSGGN